tara:strand:+ start:64313 stop:65221 length:909 start_codon:yes stop_codon:yes gene_type:complete
MPLVAVSEPVQVYRGTAHDALFGLCLDGQQGVAVGGAGLVLETADGGLSWTEMPAFANTALLDVSCGSGPNLIVSQGGAIFRANEGSYQAIDSGTDARLLAVDSNSSGLAYAVGAFGTILRSEDGGLTWELVPVDWEAILNDFVEPHLYDVQVDEAGVVTLVGEFELVVRSPDGGVTWETAHKGEASLFGLSLTADGSGFAVGQEGKIIRTSDGGSTWSEVESPTGGILLTVWSSAQGEVLISGIRNMLHSSDGGSTWDLIEGGDLNTGWYQGLVVVDDDGASSTTALLAGNQGSIIKLELN